MLEWTALSFEERSALSAQPWLEALLNAITDCLSAKTGLEEANGFRVRDLLEIRAEEALVNQVAAGQRTRRIASLAPSSSPDEPGKVQRDTDLQPTQESQRTSADECKHWLVLAPGSAAKGRTPVHRAKVRKAGELTGQLRVWMQRKDSCPGRASVAHRQKSSEATVATANFQRLTHPLFSEDDNSTANWTLLTLKPLLSNPTLRLVTYTRLSPELL